MIDGQDTLFPDLHCQPLHTRKVSHGYQAFCGCGWVSAVERLQRFAVDALAWHMNEELKAVAERADRKA